MEVTIERSGLRGRALAPGSKSYTHRALLAAGYADGGTVVSPLVSADTRATMAAVSAFGGEIEEGENSVTVTGFDGKPGTPETVIDCENSGTTMRLVTATAGLVDGIVVLTGDHSLRSRPQGPLLEAIDRLGGRAESTRGNGQAPLVVGGPIAGGRVAIPGDVSSQFISALLMAGPATSAGIDIDLTTPLKSAPYVDITLEVLADFGIDALKTADGFAVEGEQQYRLSDGRYEVPGDFSSISYLAAAGAMAGEDQVVIERAFPSAQGDTAIVDILDRMGADISWNRKAGELRVGPGDLQGITVDVGDTPDLLPTIAVLGAAASGETRITNCEHVRYKETDRVAAMAESLSGLGASVSESRDELVVAPGPSGLAGGTVDGRSDHRIIMALSLVGLVADGPIVVTGAEHVDVSFPGFFDVIESLGATVTRESVGD